MMADPGSSFFTRWSRRKVESRDGLRVGEGEQPAAMPPAALPPSATPAVTAPPAETLAETTATPSAPPPPTMDDVALLGSGSDYSRFVERRVTPEVRNAALKKLFSEPQFNVMDGLDTYISDYGRPDPLPPGMLQQMVQSKLLGLFDDEEKEAPAEAAAAPLKNEPAPALAAAPATPESRPAHEDTDLQLQPDDDAGRAGADAGAEEDAGHQH